MADVVDGRRAALVPALLDWVARGRCTEAEHIANLTATVAPHSTAGATALGDGLREQLRRIAFGTYLGVLSNETCVFNSGYSTYYDYVKAVRQEGRGWEAKLPELEAPKPYLVEFAGQIFNPLSGTSRGEPRWRETFRHRWNLFHTSGLDRNRRPTCRASSTTCACSARTAWPVNDDGDHYYCVGRTRCAPR